MLHNLWAYQTHSQTHSQSQSQSHHWSQCLSQRQSQSRIQSQSIEIEIRLQVAGRTTYGSAAFWHATPRKFRLHLAGQSIHTRTYASRWGEATYSARAIYGSSCSALPNSQSSYCRQRSFIADSTVLCSLYVPPFLQLSVAWPSQLPTLSLTLLQLFPECHAY